MPYTIEYSDQSVIDIRYIFQYSIETFGEIVAYTYLDKFNKKLEQLKNMPSIGNHRKDIPSTMRSLIVGQHCIVYEIDEEMQKMVLIRVIHARMNFEKLF